jgi:hypothetical protein
MGLLDLVTGGENEAASSALRNAQQRIGSIQVPNAAQLTLPELQQYVQAGILTPAQAQAYLQQSNALADQNINQTGTAAQIQALNQLSGVANAGAEGTPMEQAQIANAINQMNTATGGQRGAIEQAMAARGTPYALIQAALANQTAGQEAQQGYLNATNAAGNAYQTALNAMAQGGSLGGQLQGQQNTQANQVAAAQNAMQQFNAQNQQQNSQYNAANQQAANAYNTENKQNVANQNTGLANQRTTYNAQVPETVFNNQMQKATGQANVSQNQANLAQQQGQQNAGITGGLINAGATILGGMYGGPAGAAAGKAVAGQITDQNNSNYNYGAHGGIVTPIPAHYDCGHPNCGAHGGICMESGGMVPGQAPFSGDTEANDNVEAHLSPGEMVLPRSVVQQNPGEAMSLLNQQDQGVDPQDVATLLKALKSIRLGVA